MAEVNPSAFPGGDFREYEPDRGMTLRDWFAGQAMAGLCGCLARVSARTGETQAEADARWCGERADAMIAERPKGSDK